MKRLILAVVCAGLLASCKKAPKPSSEETPKSNLQRTADAVHALPPCSALIPSHWTTSRPVPILKNGVLAYNVFFFGRDGDSRGITRHDAEGWATFQADGKVLDCRMQDKDAPPIVSKKLNGLTLDQIEERERELYVLTERVAGYYSGGRELSVEGKRVVGDYSDAFLFLSSPGHAKSYLALNPDFWAWVEKNGGRAPKP